MGKMNPHQPYQLLDTIIDIYPYSYLVIDLVLSIYSIDRPLNFHL